MGFSQTLKKYLKQKIKGADLFKTPVTFLSNDKKQYASTTAGIVSLLLICYLAQMLIREGISLLNKQTIAHQQFKIDGTTTKELGQPLDKSFMFALGIDQMDLINGDERYFNFEMVFNLEKKNFQYQDGNSNNSNNSYNSYDEYDWSNQQNWYNYQNFYQNQDDDNTTGDENVQMSYVSVNALDSSRSKNFFKPCNLTYWEQKGFGRQFKRLNLQKWYCPSPQTNFFLVGKSTSKLFTAYEISITSCEEAQGLAPCASEDQIRSFQLSHQGFKLKFIYIDTIISPGVQKYLTYTLIDSYEWTLSRRLSLQAQIFLAHYVIQTDNSFLKDYNDSSIDSGVAIFEQIQYQNIPVQIMDNTYAFIILQKDPISHKYLRNFGKIDTLLAYFGGLLGTLVGIAKFFMSWYNKIEFQVNQMKNLYTFKNNKRFDTDSFNIFRGLAYYVWSKLQSFGFKKYLPTFQYYEDLDLYLTEGRKNLDIDLIIQKVLLAEKLGMILLSKEQYKALIMSDPLTIKEGKEIREQIRMQDVVLNLQLEEEEDQPSDLELPNKVPDIHPSSIIVFSAQKINYTFNSDKEDEDAEGKDYQNLSEQNKYKRKKIKSEMITIMSKLQEKVDDKNPIAERIMKRINPMIREKYIQSIVTVTPKKKMSNK